VCHAANVLTRLKDPVTAKIPALYRLKQHTKTSFQDSIASFKAVKSTFYKKDAVNDSKMGASKPFEKQ
jgi:hypothetical protein